MSRVLSCTCGAVLLLVVSLPVNADVREDLKGIAKEIKEKKQLLKKNKSVESKVSSELDQINKSLHEKEASLATLNRDLQGAEIILRRTQQEIVTVKGEAERKKQQIDLRLTSLYKAGELGNTRMFFASESLPQMSENLRYMKSVLAHDQQLFAEYNAKIDQLRVLKEKQEKDAATKEKIKENISAKKKEIETEKEKKVVYLSKVRNDTKSYLASLKELEANARRLQSMVERLEASKRKVYTTKKSIDNGVPSLPPLSDKGFGAQKGRLTIPVRGEIVDSFGRHKHPEFNSYTVSNGIAITSPLGSAIHAVYDGQVIFADYFKGYGNMVIVDHGGGFFSLYAHAAKINKKVGASVARNDVIASVGDIDSSRGPMLYFEIRYNGKPIDPSPWFK